MLANIRVFSDPPRQVLINYRDFEVAGPDQARDLAFSLIQGTPNALTALFDVPEHHDPSYRSGFVTRSGNTLRGPEFSF